MAGITPMSAQYIRTQIEIVQAAMTALFALEDPSYDDTIAALKTLCDQFYNTKLNYVQLLSIPPGASYPRIEGPRVQLDPAEHYTKEIHREGRRLRKKHGTLFSLEAITCGYQHLGSDLFVKPRDVIDRVLAHLPARKPGRPTCTSTPIRRMIQDGIKKTILHHQNEMVRLATMRKDLLAELAECGEDVEKLAAFCSKYNLR
jgi:hypothetical protein